MMKRVSVFFVWFFLFSGCTIRMVDFTVISTKNARVPSVEKGPRVVGKDCVVVFLFPFGIPNMKEAIDRAIESAGPEYDALVDGVVYMQNYAFLIGQQCYKVEGTPINTKKAVSFNKKQPDDLLKHSKRFEPVAPPEYLTSATEDWTNKANSRSLQSAAGRHVFQTSSDTP